MNFNTYTQNTYGFDLKSQIKELYTKNHKKGSILTDFDDQETEAFYVEEGIIEVGISGSEKMFILDFIFPSEICSSYVSYLKKTPSDVSITCLTDCKIVHLPLDALYDSTNENAKEFLFKEVNRYFIKRVDREKEFFLRTAKERYVNLFKYNKQLIEKIPLYKLASYLKITPESLSRIRKMIS